MWDLIAMCSVADSRPATDPTPEMLEARRLRGIWWEKVGRTLFAVEATAVENEMWEQFGKIGYKARSIVQHDRILCQDPRRMKA